MVSIGSTDITLQIIVNSLRCLALRNKWQIYSFRSRVRWTGSCHLTLSVLVLCNLVLCCCFLFSNVTIKCIEASCCETDGDSDTKTSVNSLIITIIRVGWCKMTSTLFFSWLYKAHNLIKTIENSLIINIFNMPLDETVLRLTYLIFYLWEIGICDIALC